MSSQRLNHDGVELVVATVGKGDPALLFLHPNAADHTFFSPQVDEFSTRHRVVTIDQRGYGQSGKPDGPYTPAAFAEDAAFVIQSLELDRPVVLGCSMGGAVGVELAARHPDLLRALVVLNRSVINDPTMAERLAGMAAKLRGDEGDEVLQTLVEAQIGPLDSPRLADEYRRMSESVPPWVMAATLEGFADWDGETALERLTVPALFTFSHMTGRYADLDRLCQLSAHVVIGHTVGAGHFDHLTVPEQINPMIRRFLDVYVSPVGQRG